jgi:hypothetical protein
MFDRIGLIRALNSILGLMSDGFCQACPRLAIYRKVRKNSLSAQFSVGRYKPSSSSSRPHHQVVLITKPSSSSSRSHHQAVPTTKPFPSSSRPHHQAVPITKQYSPSSHTIKRPPSQPIKSSYQATLSSRSKHPKAIVASDRSKTPKYACYGRSIVWLGRVAW